MTFQKNDLLNKSSDKPLGQPHQSKSNSRSKPTRIDTGPPKIRPKSTYTRALTLPSKSQQAYMNQQERKYHELVRNMSRESNSIALVL